MSTLEDTEFCVLLIVVFTVPRIQLTSNLFVTHGADNMLVSLICKAFLLLSKKENPKLKKKKGKTYEQKIHRKKLNEKNVKFTSCVALGK